MYFRVLVAGGKGEDRVGHIIVDGIVYLSVRVFIQSFNGSEAASCWG